MARKTTTTRPAKIDWKALRLKGKTFAFTGTLIHGERKKVAERVQAEGGRVVEDATADVDYLVVGSSRSAGPSAAEQKAQRLNQQGAAIQIIDEDQLHEMCKPSREEVVAMLTAGPKGLARWKELISTWHFSSVDFRGADFRKANLSGAELYDLTLEGANFDGANLEGATIRGAENCTFDRARMRKATVASCKGCSFRDADLRGAAVSYSPRCIFDNARITREDWSSFSGDMMDCSVKNADLTGTRLNPADVSRSDFTGAKLSVETASYTVARDAIFRNADLSDAEMDESKFDRADFTEADLSRAHLEKSVFTKATLARAKLVGADLRKAKFTSADLSGADLRDANLSGADLTGATIDGADFQGANLNGAKLAGLDLSRARNLAAQQSAGATIGPNMRKLAKVARSADKLETSAELDLGAPESVTLSMSARHYSRGYLVGAGYCHQQPRSSHSAPVDTPTFEKGMQNLVNLWYRGKLRPDTIEISASKCPLSKAELKALAIAAWHEACGLPVPSPDQLIQRLQSQKSADEQLREEMLAELRGGSAGVKKWNARDRKERDRAGKFRRLDLSGAKLAGIEMRHLDFQGTVFDGASLRDAQLGGCQLTGASFKGANLTKAWLAATKCSDANFEGAQLGKCNLRVANFRRANFKDADLAGAEFLYSDLCGANLTGANLDGVAFDYAKFDEQTRLPTGFVPPEKMRWVGKGPDPRLSPPAPLPAPAGPLDFAAFLQRLAQHTDQARLSKALQMLRAERFQLFADVGADSVVGVVKSQTDPDLVYSCRLTSAGDFSCCTQNLNPCGGLRGAPCKHLLVLLAGLAKAGRLDPASAGAWTQASRGHRPSLDKDAMSETFLRYKGAEAGTIDWRPTETIPEDYYAL
jgi:uncharacterized protein YjbI with pentapeptide repeats